MKGSDPRIIGALLMYENLNEVVLKAGGCGYKWGELQELSAADLLIRLGCNGVRFRATGKEDSV